MRLAGELFGTILLAAVPLLAMFPVFENAPVARLIANTGKQLHQKPNDASLHYLLGRLHSYAFARAQTANVFSKSGEAVAMALDEGDGPDRDMAPPLTSEDRRHATASLDEYRRAVALAPNEALYHFSLGWMYEECSHFAAALGSWPREQWMESALAEYRTAYQISSAADAKQKIRLGRFLGEQAGEAVIRLNGEAASARAENAAIRQTVDLLKQKPRAVTPVIFSLDPRARLADLTPDGRITWFDLDGRGEGRRWTWVSREACILVWDPEHAGRIASGRQLFGDVTWWMFWENGYQPLAALDDNGDGRLTGSELSGLAVWRDGNGNGVSDPGEVVPAEAMGIEEIVVRPARSAGALHHPAGIRLVSGARLATWDWIARSY
jgi:hypothetical protein